MNAHMAARVRVVASLPCCTPGAADALTPDTDAYLGSWLVRVIQGCKPVRSLAAQVRVVASLPCYTPGTVDAQRGAGVFGRSIAGLQALNAAGYGRQDSGLELDLVYNPGGPFLAPDQATLEVCRRQLFAMCQVLRRW